MKVRLTQSLASPTHSMVPGDILDLPENEATRLIEREIAVAFIEAPAISENPEKKLKREKR